MSVRTLLLACLLTAATGAALATPRPGEALPPAQRQSGPAFGNPHREWAVLVGVCQYANLPKTSWLEGCDLDATSLAEFLESPRGGAFPPDHVKTLINAEATTKSIRLALDSLIKNTQPGDVVYLFFACHGRVETYGGGDVAYLLPYDSDPEHLNATALPMEELRRYVDVNLSLCQVVLITDACHAGNLGPGGEDGRQLHWSVADHLIDLGERPGALNIMACSRSEGAIEDPRLGGHGVLTYCLLKAFNGDADSAPDGTVRAEDVLGYVMRQVPLLTHDEQHPRHSSNYSDTFPMARLSRPGAALSLPPTPTDTVAGMSSHPGFRSAGTLDLATLRVLGAPVNSELYLVQGTEQRSVGRVLSEANMLVVEGLPPGRYELVESLDGKLTRWPVQLRAGLSSFDVRAGEAQ